MPNTYFYSNGNISTGNSVGASAQNISIDSSYISPAYSTSDELPAITFSTNDETGRAITMTLAPESGISTNELTKIFMLSLTMIHGSGRSVNALSYVKKHNLERHFTYS